ncbi:exocyst complex component Sec10-like protein [Multifurca ochricompacta]|uniref:Exocyst complex component Sec10-like protein n=1 Tax=Multifurca ochricompacta TaxID=376703 RepID=A0AAD4M316_9AGAM|nr:exocyst complex component Sec10-like protein [Multifurca ochricompacta]
MDKFKALEPVKLHQGSTIRSKNTASGPASTLIGKLPSSLHLVILHYIPVPDVPAYARANRALARLSTSEVLWEHHYVLLGIDRYGFGPVLDELESRARQEVPEQPPTLTVDVADDDFGDFTSGTDTFGLGLGGSASQSGLFSTSYSEVGNFVGSDTVMHGTNVLGTTSFRALYIRAHKLLKSLAPALLEPPHQILTSLFRPATASAPLLSLLHRSKTLRLLHRFLSLLEPLRSAPSLLSALRSASDRFDATLLSAFDIADGNANEAGMREAAEASWEIWDPHDSGSGATAEWEMGRVWAEKREIFYVTSSHKPLDNFTSEDTLNFEAMDTFMAFVLDALREHGSRAVRVFPRDAGVLLSFADHIAAEVVSEYITPLLTHARSLANGALFLKAAAACFREAWRMVDTLLELASQRHPPNERGEVTKTQAEDVVYRMFEPNMDEYLDEEIDSLKHIFEQTCRDWEKKTTLHTDASPPLVTQQPTFLASSSPARLKSNVLSTFTNLLLIPVSIVPRTVETVSGAAVHGIAMLDPRRWGGAGQINASEGYTKGTDSANAVLWDDGDNLEVTNEQGDDATAPATTSVAPRPSRISSYDNLQLLLSLDVTLELIHATRESLKRVEIFVNYPGTYGIRVRETIEEVASELLGILGERHVRAGFESAITQMRAYQPPELSDPISEPEEPAPASTSVAPLVQFFELVHIGDMIQSIVQVYFDKELAPHVDLTDFLNPVVREKKRFENLLDDSVAKGLNAGIEVLMNQVDHIITALTPPRTYYPPEDAPLLLGPSKGCTEAIKCLEEHIRLLQGNVNREVLEVFEGEVGVRLIGILQKHIKRQIISLNGGFQVIADLNTYHTFISSLKIQSLTSDFANLKMLGHVFIVEDAKDLAQIVRDVTRYGGAYRPEDIYEFIQRRSDWKKIEKVVDKTMYNLNLREDCIIS